MLTITLAGLVVASIIVAILRGLHQQAELDRRWDELAHVWAAPERKWNEDWRWED